MTTEIKYYRRHHLIHTVNGTLIFTGKYQFKNKTLPSVNAAKRESRKLQKLHGQGCVQVKS